MANIMDYLDWRGDVPFSVAPFCEVDSLVFSKFCFIDLKGIVPERVAEQGVSLSQAADQYMQATRKSKQTLGLILPAQIRPFVQRMARCARYRDVIVRGFVDHIDESLQKQFAAMTLEISPDEVYVVFRGTDDTLVGWKENFNMSFLTAVPAQLDAVAYLNEVGTSLSHSRIIVGGYSKGGNLAIYSAIRCHEDIKPRITCVYNNDGPGYRREVIASREYQEMESRIVNIIPQTSVIGRLLEHDEKYKVIHSTASGLWQHDGFSWEVKGTMFVPAPALTQESEMIDRSLKKWISEMSEEQCEEVVDSLYRILTATNAKTLTELTHDRNWFWQLMSSSDPQSKKMLFNALSQLTGEAGRQWIETVLPTLVKTRKAKEIALKQEAATKEIAVTGQEEERPVLRIAPCPQTKRKAKNVLKLDGTKKNSQTANKKPTVKKS